MILNIASAVGLVSLDVSFFEIGEALPTMLAPVLLIGGLIALLRIRRDNTAFGAPNGRVKNIATACVAVGGLIVLGSLSRWASSISFEPERRIVIAETAGGVHRVELAPQYTVALEQQRGVAAKEDTDLQYGGYAHPNGGEVPVLFIGLEQKDSDPRKAITDFLGGIAKGRGEQRRELTAYPAGDLGGEVRCSAGSELRCGWADRSTIGVVMATGCTEAELAALLVKMRTDLEQKR
ncbi:hypothetical protein OG474_41640 [Kribbella sp. NBC_01505]|uniref:hypothetical protein n=1 Tax=Kribbella sp. NBC_01505 TaxID=2903580 RepID=UPI00386CCCB2